MIRVSLRYFNQLGIDEFARQLEQIEQTGSIHSLENVLSDPALSVQIEKEKTIEVINFVDRFSCGEYFNKKFGMVESSLKSAGVNPIGHRGLWTWLGALWAEQLLKNSKGDFFVGAHERYVLSTSMRRDYRHLLYGPWLVYCAGYKNLDLIRIVLNDLVTKDSAVFEQLASRKEIISNTSALELVNKCYRDTVSGAVYPQSLRGDIPGGLRRFGAVYSQLAVNFDLHNMEIDEIEQLLPKEFDSWLSGELPKTKTSKKSSGRQSSSKKKSNAK